MDFDGYDIVRPEEGQPRPKYIFKNFETLTPICILCEQYLLFRLYEPSTRGDLPKVCPPSVLYSGENRMEKYFPKLVEEEKR